jgi:hypothetical protein
LVTIGSASSDQGPHDANCSSVDLAAEIIVTAVKRGSRRRIKQLRFRDHWSPEMSFMVGVVVLLLIVLLSWFGTH